MWGDVFKVLCTPGVTDLSELLLSPRCSDVVGGHVCCVLTAPHHHVVLRV